MRIEKLKKKDYPEMKDIFSDVFSHEPWFDRNEYFIKEFFIKRNRQKQGLGSKFIEKLNNYLKKMDFKYIILNTDKDTPAFKFYQKNDFQLEEKSVFMSKIID